MSSSVVADSVNGRPTSRHGGPRHGGHLSKRRRRIRRGFLSPLALAASRRNRRSNRTCRRQLLPPPSQHIPSSARTTEATASGLRLPRQAGYLPAGSSSRPGGVPCGVTAGCTSLPAGTAARGARGDARSGHHRGKQIVPHCTTTGRREAAGGLRDAPSPRPRLPQGAAVNETDNANVTPIAGRTYGSPTWRRVQHRHQGLTRTQSSGADRIAPLLLRPPISTQLLAKDRGHSHINSRDVDKRGVAATSDVPPKVMVIQRCAASEELAALADADCP